MRGIIRANQALPGLPRGAEVVQDITDRDVKRAASGQISIVRTWPDDPIADVVAGQTVDSVLAQVDAGALSADEVFEAEQAGRGRSGILDRLRPTQHSSGEAPAAADHHAGVMPSDDGPQAGESS